MSLTHYRTLGHSGLIVSPLTLGTMTFGAGRWGVEAAAATAIFNAYTEAGGNSLDTADVYSGGKSEELVGQMLKERRLRDQMVLATKCGFGAQRGNPNGGGNGRKHIYQSVEASLRRLQTDYIDLYWMHVWDTLTPAAEVLQTLTDLVRSGKIRYFALSDTPAWYAAKMATLAAAQNISGPVALQLSYSLVERNAENEHLPAARDCGLSLMPWSPLAGGFLTGKYEKTESGTGGEGRLAGPNPLGDSMFTDRNWAILETLKRVAKELSLPPAQVALAWLCQRPGVGSVIIGASKVAQVQDNIAALGVALSPAQLERLNEASLPADVFPYPIYREPILSSLFGGHEVKGG